MVIEKNIIIYRDSSQCTFVCYDDSTNNDTSGENYHFSYQNNMVDGLPKYLW